MGIDLAGQGRQACFIEAELLDFQFLLIASIVPDFERQNDREDGSDVDGDQGRVGGIPFYG